MAIRILLVFKSEKSLSPSCLLIRWLRQLWGSNSYRSYLPSGGAFPRVVKETPLVRPFVAVLRGDTMLKKRRCAPRMVKRPRETVEREGTDTEVDPEFCGGCLGSCGRVPFTDILLALIVPVGLPLENPFRRSCWNGAWVFETSTGESDDP